MMHHRALAFHVDLLFLGIQRHSQCIRCDRGRGATGTSHHPSLGGKVHGSFNWLNNFFYFFIYIYVLNRLQDIWAFGRYWSKPLILIHLHPQGYLLCNLHIGVQDTPVWCCAAAPLASSALLQSPLPLVAHNWVCMIDYYPLDHGGQWKRKTCRIGGTRECARYPHTYSPSQEICYAQAGRTALLLIRTPILFLSFSLVALLSFCCSTFVCFVTCQSTYSWRLLKNKPLRNVVYATLFLYIYMNVCVCVWMYVRVRVCVHVCMYLCK